MEINQKYSNEILESWIIKVTQEFYERVYKHDWLYHVFKSIPQEFIASQQIDFMLGLMGGPKRFTGRHAKDAHPHIFVDEEMWQLREALLKEAFIFVNCPADIQELWLNIDEAFKKFIVLDDPSKCQKRFTNDELIIVPKPMRRAG